MNYKSQTDEVLMLFVQKGDKEAFIELYNRYCDAMYRFFLRLYFYDEPKSRDATQDLFVKVLEKPELFDSNRKFSSWLYAVATNLFRNDIRNEKRRKEIIEQRVFQEEFSWPDISRKIDKSVFEKAIQERLKRLDVDQQLLLSLRFEHEKSISEIADIMNVAEGTVKSRLFYLLKRLGEGLK